MTSKTTTKASNPKTSKKTSEPQSRTKHSRRKSNRINRQRRLQKQLQVLLLERHSRRCIICHHPEREAIEEEFVHWRAPWKLAQDYKLADYRTIYRHARAAGLLLQRRERLHSALDAFVESVDDVTFTGDTILRAMRAYSCIDDHGRWTEIPTQVQFSTSTDPHPPQPSSRSSNVDSNVIDIDADEESEEGEDNMLEEHVTASAALRAQSPAHSTSSKSMSRCDNTACLPRASRGAASPAQSPDRWPGVTPDILDIAPKSSNHASRSDATACSASSKSTPPSDATDCAASPAQAFSATEDDYADPENDDDPDDDMDDDPNDDPDVDPDDDPDDDNDPKNKSEARRHEETTTCLPRASRGADSPAQALPRDVDRGQNPNDRPLSDRTDSASTMKNAACHAAHPNRSSGQQETGRGATATACLPRASRGADSPAQTASAVALNSNNCGRSMTATACADSPAQALPRDVDRGQIPNDRSPSDRTDGVALPAQPPAPQKPEPDADGLIWHPRPGYPNQEISEPDAEGRVLYKIYMTASAPPPPPRETDAQRAAELIYRSVIKKYGNP